jgi:hypothetical protein
MTTKRIETWTWILIYGGLVVAILGWFVTPTRGPWGELMVAGGAVATVIGVVLIFVRARMEA